MNDISQQDPERAACEQVRLELSARHDGEWAATDRTELDQHLAGCADCRCFAASLDDVSDRLAPLRGVQAPTRVGAALPHSHPSGSRPSGPAPAATRWALRAAAGLLGFALVQLGGSGGPGRGGAGSPPSAVELLRRSQLHGHRASPEHAPPEYALLMHIQQNSLHNSGAFR